MNTLHQFTAASTWWCGPRPCLGWDEMAVGLPEGPRYPGHSPLFFRYAAPWTTAEGQLTASSKSVACFLIFFSPALLLPFFVSSFFSFSWWAVTFIPTLAPSFLAMCAENVTWRGKSVQCCTYSRWVHLRCSQLFLSRFRALGSSHFWICHPCRNTVTTSLTFSDRYTSTVQFGLPLLMLHSRPILVSKSLIPHLPILYLLPLPLHHRPLLLAFLLRLLPSLLPLTVSRFFNGMLEVFKPGALNYFTFSRPIMSTLFASGNPILTPLSEFLDSLLCSLIAPTPGLAFSLLMTRTLAVALSFLSGRTYPFLNFLPPLFLRLIPTLIM